MRENKNHIYLDSQERTLLLHSRLVEKPVGFLCSEELYIAALTKRLNLCERRTHSMSNCKVIALTNQKGGVGYEK